MFVYHAGTGTVIDASEIRIISSEYSDYFLDNEPNATEAAEYGLALDTILQEWMEAE